MPGQLGRRVGESAVVVHVLAEAATVDGRQRRKPGFLPGYGAVPAATIAELANRAGGCAP